MNSKYLYLYDQNGEGSITCKDCGHTVDDVLAFIHGFGEGSSCTYGVQCQECGTFGQYWDFDLEEYKRITREIETDYEIKYTGRSIVFSMEMDSPFDILQIAIFLPKWLRPFFPREIKRKDVSYIPERPRKDCPKCNSLKISRSQPIFCPKCKSYNVKYKCEYET
ncbi:MAG: hypothetical protein R3Y26_02905 [Rikenellaceae bacterium]